MKAGNNLAIRWSDRPDALNRAKRNGGVEVFGQPQHLKIPGGKVMLVTKGGVVRLIFTVATIKGPQRVRLPDGKQRTGYVVGAKRNSFHSPHGNEPQKLGIRWYAIGQYRYLNPRTNKPVLIGSPVRGEDPYLDENAPSFRDPIFHPFRDTIPSYPKNYEEAKLVRAYLDWLRDNDGFGQNFLREAGLFVDLFDRRKWRLIEAKAAANREKVRMAVGQLMDYRRFYERSPSLGVLCPEKPTPACLAYLNENRVTAIWQTPGGSFRDSTEGQTWTIERRRNG